MKDYSLLTATCTHSPEISCVYRAKEKEKAFTFHSVLCNKKERRSSPTDHVDISVLLYMKVHSDPNHPKVSLFFDFSKNTEIVFPCWHWATSIQHQSILLRLSAKCPSSRVSLCSVSYVWVNCGVSAHQIQYTSLMILWSYDLWTYIKHTQTEHMHEHTLTHKYRKLS